MPIRLRDRWFIFVPGSGRWAIPAAHAGTEEKRIAYAIDQGAKNIVRNDKIEWRA